MEQMITGPNQTQGFHDITTPKKTVSARSCCGTAPRMRVRDRRHLSRHVRRKVASSQAMHHSHTHSRALVSCPSGSDAGPHPSPRRASSSSYRHIYSSSRHPPERPATRNRATCSSHGVGRGARPEAAVPRDGHLLAHRPVARAPLGRVCAGELADVEHPPGV